MDWMTASAAPRMHLESLAYPGQGKKAAVQQMTEICPHWDLRCSDCGDWADPLGCLCMSCRLCGFTVLTAGVH